MSAVTHWARRGFYVLLACLIFVTEVAIAKGIIGGPFVRGSLGDVLVIALIYFFVRGVWAPAMERAALFAVGVGFVVEALQAVHLADLLGLSRGSVLSIALGNTFSWSDLLMYAVGGVVAYAVDRWAIGG